MTKERGQTNSQCGGVRGRVVGQDDIPTRLLARLRRIRYVSPTRPEITSSAIFTSLDVHPAYPPSTQAQQSCRNDHKATTQTYVLPHTHISTSLTKQYPNKRGLQSLPVPHISRNIKACTTCRRLKVCNVLSSPE